MRFCVDASLMLASLLREELSDFVDPLLRSWVQAGAQLLAPPLFRIEVPSGLRQAAHRKRIEIAEAIALFDSFLRFPIRIGSPDRLLQRAWEIGNELDSPRLYDMLYVALADIEECELWTADRRLVNLASRRFPHVRFVGEAAA